MSVNLAFNPPQFTDEYDGLKLRQLVDELERLHAEAIRAFEVTDEINDLTAAVVWANVPDANITESSVTQHEGALTLAASQTTSGTFANARISQGSVTQHEAALTILSSQVNMSRLAGSTFLTLQEVQDIFHSGGHTSGGAGTDAGSNLLDVAAGTGLIRATNDPLAELLFFDWPAVTGLSVPLDTTRFVGVEYNAGTPQAVVRSTENWDFQTDFPIAVVTNEGGTIRISNTPHAVGDHAAAMIRRTHETMGIKRDNRTGGLILGVTGTLKVTVSAGALWDKLNRSAVSAIDTSAAGTFNRYHRDGAGGHTIELVQTDWDDNGYDDNSGGVAVMTNNKYAVQWWYMTLGGGLLCQYGQAEYNTRAGAEAEQPPGDAAQRIKQMSSLIGRFVFQKGDAVPVIETVFETDFGGAQVDDHGGLTGLTDDDHTQYTLADATRDFTGSPMVTSLAPAFKWNETDAAADNRRWQIIASSEALIFRASNDAENLFGNFLTVGRTGGTIDTIDFVGTAFDISGALTATSYGGITEANLLDKTASETIIGAWNFTVANVAPGAGSKLSTDMLYLDAKEAIDGNDTFLRINQNGDFTAGIFTPGAFRADGAISFGTGGGGVNITVGGAITAQDDLTIVGDVSGTTIGGITEANLLDKNATESIGGRWVFSDSIDLLDNASVRFGNGADITMTWDGVDLEIDALTAGRTIQFRSGMILKIWDGSNVDNVSFSHDGTDFNIAGTTTTDINITGVTAIAAGTVDADFDALTATSYGGITEANLLDKTATESIAGAWTFDDTILTRNILERTFFGQATGSWAQWGPNNGGHSAVVGSHNNTDSAVLNYAAYFAYDCRWDETNDQWVANRTTLGKKFMMDMGFHNATVRFRYFDGTVSSPWADSAWTDLLIIENDGDAQFLGNVTGAQVAGIVAGNLLDKTAAETITGVYTFTNELISERATPILRFTETDAAADNQKWEMLAVAEQLRFRTSNDAGSVSANWLTVDRTGTTINAIAFGGALTATSYGGITEANLLDKSAAETITGAYQFNAIITAKSNIHLDNAFFLNARNNADSGDVPIVKVNASDVIEFGSGGFSAQFTGPLDVVGALTATSYGGITEANLLDKTAAETIPGAWDFTAAVGLASATTIKANGGNATQLWFNDEAETRKWIIGTSGAAVNDDFLIFSSDTGRTIMTIDDSSDAISWHSNVDHTFNDADLIRANLKDYSVQKHTETSSGGVLTIDMTLGNSITHVMTENISTVTISNPPVSGTYGEVLIKMHQHASSAKTVTWASKYKFPAGANHVMTTTLGAVDMIHCSTINAGVEWQCTYAQDFK